MTVFGWDLSHYDAPAAPPPGIAFQTHKAGGDANDAELGAWWNLARNSSALLGAYWVLYPGSPAARADAFIARLDSQCPGWRDRPFILQADCEKWGGDDSTVPSVSEINTFCGQLRKRMPKLMPIVYAPKWVYGSSVSTLKYPLWASSYVTGSGSFTSLYPGDSSSKWAAYGGITPTILQYTSSATIAGQTTCDANAFRGTLDELISIIAPGWSADVANALTTDDIPTIVNGVVSALTAGITFTDAGGGTHNKISDAVWNGDNITNPDGVRTHAWSVMHSIQVAQAQAQQSLDALAVGGNTFDLDAFANKVADVLAARLAS